MGNTGVGWRPLTPWEHELQPQTFITGVGGQSLWDSDNGQKCCSQCGGQGLGALSLCQLVAQNRNHSGDFQGKVLNKGNEVLAPSLERLR